MAKIRYIVRVVQADKEIVLRVPVAPETTVGQLQAEVLARANKKGFLGTTCELSVAGASLDEADHLEDVVDEGETIGATLTASAAPTPAPATQFVFGSGAPTPTSPTSPFVFGATSPAASSPASPAFSFNAPPPTPPPASASTSTPKLRLTEPPTPPTPPALPPRRPAAPPIAKAPAPATTAPAPAATASALARRPQDRTERTVRVVHGPSPDAAVEVAASPGLSLREFKRRIARKLAIENWVPDIPRPAGEGAEAYTLTVPVTFRPGEDPVDVKLAPRELRDVAGVVARLREHQRAGPVNCLVSDGTLAVESIPLQGTLLCCGAPPAHDERSLDRWAVYVTIEPPADKDADANAKPRVVTVAVPNWKLARGADAGGGAMTVGELGTNALVALLGVAPDDDSVLGRFGGALQLCFKGDDRGSLDATDTLEQARVGNGASLVATPAPGAEAAFASFPVFTKTLTGATHVVRVAPYDDVHDVCSTVADRLEGARNVRLVYGGKQLKEGDRVYAYGIARDSTIHVVLRVGRERQRLAPLLAAPRVTIDVALASHACRSTCETDGRSLEAWGLLGNEVFAVVRQTRTRESAADAAATDKADAPAAVFGADEAWQPDFSQTDEALATFLASLYVFANVIGGDEEVCARVLATFRALAFGYAPAIATLSALAANEPVNAADKAALSKATYAVLRRFDSPGPEELTFASTRRLFAFLLAQETSPAFALRAERRVTTSLRCARTDERLGADAEVVELDDGSFCLAAADPGGVRVASALCLALCLAARAEADEIVRWAPVPPADGDAEAARELVETRDALAEFSRNALALMVKDQARLALFAPRQLVRAPRPSLTRDDQGLHAVYTSTAKGGRGGGSVHLAQPLKGAENLFEVVALAAAHARLGLEADAVELVDRGKADEVVVICLDTSRSMEKSAQFSQDAEGESDESDESSNVGWDWASEAGTDSDTDGDDTDGTAEADGEDAEVDEGARRASAAVAAQAAARVAAARREFDEVTKVLTTLPFFHLLRAAAAEVGGDLVMRELCEQDSPVDPRESRFYAVFSRHHREIESILEDDDDEEVGAGDDDDDDMPSAFRCPITFAPMFDPVVAADGHSYDRTALQQWFERGRTTSPMHGGALANQSFVTNQALKSQVAEWLQRRGADQQPGPDDAKISVRVTFSGSTEPAFTVDLPTGARGRHVKLAVARETSLRVWPRSLVTGGRALGDDTALARYARRATAAGASTLAVTAVAAGNADASLVAELKRSGRATVRLATNASETVTSLTFRYWLSNLDDEDAAPCGRTWWVGLNDVGDGQQRGWRANHCGLEETIGNFSRHAVEPDDGGAPVLSISLYSRDAPPSRRRGPEPISRIAAVQASLHAYLNRSAAYRLRTVVGGISFGSDVEVFAEPTWDFDELKARLDDVEADGDTKLYDAILRGVDVVVAAARNHEGAAMRLIVLSDGRDSSSAASALECLQKLRAEGVVLDAIQVADQDNHLPGIAAGSGGIAVRPQSLKDGLRLFEDETVLDIRARRSRPVNPAAARCRDVRSLAHVDAVEDRSRQREEPAPTAPPDAGAVRKVQRALQEVKKAPHAGISVLPDDEDAMIWHLIVDGPESTPYADGTWRARFRFPGDFPRSPPECRFVTPIRHANINTSGRVCHSIFDRAWTPATKMRSVLNYVYGLMLNPDHDDPLDSTLALAFYQAEGDYEAEILAHTKAHASRTHGEIEVEIESASASLATRIFHAGVLLRTGGRDALLRASAWLGTLETDADEAFDADEWRELGGDGDIDRDDVAHGARGPRRLRTFAAVRLGLAKIALEAGDAASASLRATGALDATKLAHDTMYTDLERTLAIEAAIGVLRAEALYVRSQAARPGAGTSDNLTNALRDCVDAYKVLEGLPRNSAPGLAQEIRRAHQALKVLKKERQRQERALYANAFGQSDGGRRRRRGS